MFSSLKSGRGGDAHGLGLALLKRSRGAGGEIFIRDSQTLEQPSFCACRLQYDGLITNPLDYSATLTARYSILVGAVQFMRKKGR